jgi:protocatechuate 3,4-dioxygenase beta subunit
MVPDRDTLLTLPLDAPSHPLVELVVVATDQAATLDASVKGLHRHLADRFPPLWRLTIADHASTDATLTVAHRLAAELDRVAVVHLPERLDRKALRATWGRSPAEVVAFLTVTPERDLDALLAPIDRHLGPGTMSSEPLDSTPRRATPEASEPSLLSRRLTRRTALAAVGGIGLTAFLAACGGNGSSSTATTAGAGSTTTRGGDPATTTNGSTSPATTSTPATTGAGTATTTASVVLQPEMTEGPYYLDLDLVRSDIAEDREGAPLALNLVVIDVETGQPLEGAAVDIWHCDANGLYSGFVDQSAGSNQGATDLSDSGTFLRGTQLTDASGAVTFATIYPGWYQGRTVHIHLKVHVSGREIHTGQLFFDDTFTDEVFATNEPYSGRSERSTRNDNDNIYGGGGNLSLVPVEPRDGGYAGGLTMGVSA